MGEMFESESSTRINNFLIRDSIQKTRTTTTTMPKDLFINSVDKKEQNEKIPSIKAPSVSDPQKSSTTDGDDETKIKVSTIGVTNVVSTTTKKDALDQKGKT